MSAAPPLRPPRVGDVTIVPYPRVRALIGCGEEAGILMEDRRSALRVFFPASDRTFWLDRDRVTAVDPGQVPLHPLAARLHAVAQRVAAVQIEQREVAPEAEGREGAFDVYAVSLTLPDLLHVRDLLGPDLVDLRLEAGSVRRVRLALRFRLPPA